MPPRREAREKSDSSRRHRRDGSGAAAYRPRAAFGRRMVCHVRKPRRLGGLGRVAHVTAQSPAARRRPGSPRVQAGLLGPRKRPGPRAASSFWGDAESRGTYRNLEPFREYPKASRCQPFRAPRVPRGAFLFIVNPTRQGTGGKCGPSRAEFVNTSGSNQSHLRSCFQPLNGSCALPATRRCDVADWLRF